jgi:hypothetical protein
MIMLLAVERRGFVFHAMGSRILLSLELVPRDLAARQYQKDRRKNAIIKLDEALTYRRDLQL